MNNWKVGSIGNCLKIKGSLLTHFTPSAQGKQLRVVQWSEHSSPTPMCPGFKHPYRRHIWLTFVVGSLPAPRGFSPGTPVFPSPQKPTLPNSNSNLERMVIFKRVLTGYTRDSRFFRAEISLLYLNS